MLGISELAILLIVLILMFGARRLPELARSAGKAARILKSEAKAMKKDGSPAADESAPRVVRVTPGDTTAHGPDGDRGAGDGRRTA